MKNKKYLIGLQVVFLVIAAILTAYAAILASPIVEYFFKDVHTSEETAGMILVVVLFLPILIIGGGIDGVILIANICLAGRTVKNAYGPKRRFGIVCLILSIILLVVLIASFVLFFVGIEINNAAQATSLIL